MALWKQGDSLKITNRDDLIDLLKRGKSVNPVNAEYVSDLFDDNFNPRQTVELSAYFNKAVEVSIEPRNTFTGLDYTTRYSLVFVANIAHCTYLWLSSSKALDPFEGEILQVKLDSNQPIWEENDYVIYPDFDRKNKVYNAFAELGYALYGTVSKDVSIANHIENLYCSFKYYDYSDSKIEHIVLHI